MNLPVNYDEISAGERRSVREEYVRLQNGKCCHCDNSLEEGPSEAVAQMHVTRSLFPPQFFKWPVHLHHCHETGLTIGAVHSYCNAVLWEHHGE